jgi:hypothetical protein
VPGGMTVRMTAASPTDQGSFGKTLNDASRVRRRSARVGFRAS